MGLQLSTESTAVLQRGFQESGWTISRFWIAAVGIGGGFGRHDVEAIATGERPATPAEHDVLAVALNDEFVDRGQDHPVSIWRDLGGH